MHEKRKCAGEPVMNNELCKINHRCHCILLLLLLLWLKILIVGRLFAGRHCWWPLDFLYYFKPLFSIASSPILIINFVVISVFICSNAGKSPNDSEYILMAFATVGWALRSIYKSSNIIIFMKLLCARAPYAHVWGHVCVKRRVLVLYIINRSTQNEREKKVTCTIQ